MMEDYTTAQKFFVCIVNYIAESNVGEMNGNNS